MDKLVPPLPPSEYGQMPAAHYANSQRVAPTTVHTDSVDGSAEQSTSPPRPVRGPILMRDRYEGVDSDDESTDSEGGGGGGDADDDEGEDAPQVVGEVEVDMGEEEDEFLEFSRRALGIDDEQWAQIIRERRSRGAFVPAHITVNESPTKTKKTAEGTKASTRAAASNEPKLRAPEPGPRPNTNPNLDSFEAVMQAMEDELARARAAKTAFQPPDLPTGSKDKGKGRATEMDIEAAMDAELHAALDAGEEDGAGEVDEDGLPIGGEGLDYNLIKNFLESFKSQGGLPGPVSNLAGRLQPGWNLPRDEA